MPTFLYLNKNEPRSVFDHIYLKQQNSSTSVKTKELNLNVKHANSEACEFCQFSLCCPRVVVVMIREDNKTINLRSVQSEPPGVKVHGYE